MCQKIADLSRWERSTLSIIALCLIATFLLSACDDAPQSTAAAALPTGVMTPTTTHATALMDSTGPDAVDGVGVRNIGSRGPVGGADVEGGSSTAPPIGSTWVLHSRDGRPVIDGSFVALKVYEASIGGYGGCNRIGIGPLTIDGEPEPPDPKPFFGTGGVIHQTGLFINARGCAGPEGLAEQEDGFVRALTAGTTYRLDDDRLQIFGRNGVLRLSFFRQEPLPGEQIDLDGTAWRQMGDGAGTLVFLGGLVNGETACRDLLATYRLFPRLRFPSIGMRGSGESCSEEEWASECITDFLSYAWEYSVYEDAGSRQLGMRSSEGDTRIFEQLPPTFENINDGEWSLRSFARLGEGSTRRSTQVIPGSKVTISFGDDGFSGTAGCNNYRGLAKVRGGSITVDVRSIHSGEEACEGRGLVEQEARYLGLLPKLTQYWVYGDALYMRTNDDVRLLFGAE